MTQREGRSTVSAHAFVAGWLSPSPGDVWQGRKCWLLLGEFEPLCRDWGRARETWVQTGRGEPSAPQSSAYCHAEGPQKDLERPSDSKETRDLLTGGLQGREDDSCD